MTRLGIAVAALVLAFAAPASAMVQLDKGIAGVRIGNTRAQVRAALGTPAKQRSGSNDFGSFVQYAYAGGITVVFQGEDRVTSVATTGLGDRTSNGIGVGSVLDDVKAHIPGIKCEGGVCHTGRLAAGRRVTSFSIASGKVASIQVGIVLD
jgi:hypothetical protein